MYTYPGLQSAISSGGSITSDQAGQALQVVAAGLGIQKRRRSTAQGGRRLLEQLPSARSQLRLLNAISFLNVAAMGLSASISPTEVKSVSSSGISLALMSDLRINMVGKELEAGPDANGDQQPNSTANTKVVLPDTLQLPSAACVDDGVNCIEPPSLLRLDTYDSLALFADVLTTPLLSNSSSINYTYMNPLSVVVNISVPTNVELGSSLTCQAGASNCTLTLQLPLVTVPDASITGAACVQLVEVAGQVTSTQIPYPAVITTTDTGTKYATCAVPNFGTYLALQYKSPVTSPVSLVEAPLSTASTSQCSPCLKENRIESANVCLSGGQIAGIVVGTCAGTCALLVVVFIVAARIRLPLPFRALAVKVQPVQPVSQPSDRYNSPQTPEIPVSPIQDEGEAQIAWPRLDTVDAPQVAWPRLEDQPEPQISWPRLDAKLEDQPAA